MKNGKSSCGCGGRDAAMPRLPEYATPRAHPEQTRRGHPVSAPAETLFFSNVRFDFPRGSFRAL